MSETRRRTAAGGPAAGSDDIWTDEERAAMKEAVRERKTAARRRGSADDRAQGELDVQARIAGMPEPDRTIARRVHELVMEVAPDLSPRTWYGMPAYTKDGNVVCFFQDAAKFKARYATLGFSDKAHLDDGPMWPTVYALAELTPEVERSIVELVKKAAS